MCEVVRMMGLVKNTCSAVAFAILAMLGLNGPLKDSEVPKCKEIIPEKTIHGYQNLFYIASAVAIVSGIYFWTRDLKRDMKQFHEDGMKKLNECLAEFKAKHGGAKQMDPVVGIITLNEQLEMVKVQNEKYFNELRRVKEENDVMRKKIMTLEANFNGQGENIRRVRAEYNIVCQEKAKLEAVLRTKKQELDQAMQCILDIKKECLEVQSKNQVLKTDMECMKRDLGNRLQICQELQNDLEHNKQMLKDEKMENMGLKAGIEKCEIEIFNLKQNRSEILKNGECLKDEIQFLNQEIEMHKKKNHEQSQLNEKLHSELQFTKLDIEEILKRKREERLGFQRNKLIMRLKALLTDWEEKAEQIRFAKQMEIEKAFNAVKCVREELIAKEREFGLSQLEAETARSNNQMLNAKVNDLEADMKIRADQMNNMKDQVSKLQEEGKLKDRMIEKAEVNLQTLQDQVAEGETTRIDLEGNLNLKENENADLRQIVKEKDQLNQEQEITIKELFQERRRLHLELEKEKRRNEELFAKNKYEIEESANMCTSRVVPPAFESGDRSRELNEDLAEVNATGSENFDMSNLNEDMPVWEIL